MSIKKAAVTMAVVSALLLTGCATTLPGLDPAKSNSKPGQLTAAPGLFDSDAKKVNTTYTSFMLALNQMDPKALEEWVVENQEKAYDPNLSEKDKKALLRSVKALFNDTVTNSVYDNNLTLDEKLDFWLNLSKISGSLVLFNPIAAITVDEDKIKIEGKKATIDPANIHIQILVQSEDGTSAAEHYPTESGVQLIQVNGNWYYDAKHTLQNPVNDKPKGDVQELTE